MAACPIWSRSSGCRLLQTLARLQRESSAVKERAPSRHVRRAKRGSTGRAFARPSQAALAGILLAAVWAAGCDIGGEEKGEAGGGPHANGITGRVLALDGSPVAGARVIARDGEAKTDRRGRFRLGGARRPQWITAKHPEFLSRTRPASPASPTLVRLTPDDGETVSLHFGGDVMFGRRFYDSDEDGVTADGLLAPGSGKREHLALLRHVKPLLEDADVTAVNLETSLIDRPYYHLHGRRPGRFHQTKEFAFASHTSSAGALKAAGVDLVDLGNNHLFDALSAGVTQTLGSLHRAGFAEGRGHFGAGESESGAWRAAIIRPRGQPIAFLGCTTITGEEHPVTYVAAGAKAGAAACDERTLHSRVTALRRRHGAVVVMIHGGFEYRPKPSPRVRRMSAAARAAGATLVVNHHPHVIGGFLWRRRSLTAWTLGNLLFDQNIWPTFQSYVLAVHLRRGRVVRAYVEPLLIDGYRPRGVTGDLADAVAREAAGVEPGPFVVENGSMEVDVDGLGLRRRWGSRLRGTRRGAIYRIGRGAWLSSFSGSGRAQPGRDLLWVGGFEDEDVDPAGGPGGLWILGGSTRLGPRFACSGNAGVRIEREAINTSAALLTSRNRLLVRPGTELSLVGMVRMSANARPAIELAIYPHTKGPPAERERASLPGRRPGAWMPFRLDLTVPPGTAGVAPFLRLDPPVTGPSFVDFDDVRLIEWARPGVPPSLRHPYVRVFGRGRAGLRHDFFPGAADRAWSGGGGPGTGRRRSPEPVAPVRCAAQQSPE
jgi:poly-gamma-glutamate capsule biosynthesis protein CapA/YwtB (metallophosphatase superfamily)